MKNDIEALRHELFATLRALRDKNNPMDLDRAKIVSEVAKVITDTAKVEVDWMRVTGLDATDFVKQRELPNGIVSRTVHKLQG